MQTAFRFEQRRVIRTAGLAVGLFAVVMGLSGCQNSAQSGAAIGAGIGVLAGQAIGGDTEGTLIGGVIGAGTGYIIGNEIDKQEGETSKTTSADNEYPDDASY